MQQGTSIGAEAFDDIAIPRVAGGVYGHVDRHGRAKNGAAWNATPEAAVVRVAAVIAHHEVLIFGNGQGRSVEGREQFIVRRKFGGAGGVVFLQLRAVDPDGTVMNLDFVAWQADYTFDEIGLVWFAVGRLEDDDLLALGISPQRNVNVGEWDSGVVTDAAHDEMIADEQRVFHVAGRDDASLPESPVDQHEDEADPEPSHDFFFDLSAHGGVGLLCPDVFGFLFGRVSFHVSPWVEKRVLSMALCDFGITGLKPGHYMWPPEGGRYDYGSCSTVTRSVDFPFEELSRTSSWTRSVG